MCVFVFSCKVLVEMLLGKKWSKAVAYEKRKNKNKTKTHRIFINPAPPLRL